MPIWQPLLPKCCASSPRSKMTRACRPCSAPASLDSEATCTDRASGTTLEGRSPQSPPPLSAWPSTTRSAVPKHSGDRRLFRGGGRALPVVVGLRRATASPTADGQRECRWAHSRIVPRDPARLVDGREGLQGSSWGRHCGSLRCHSRRHCSTSVAATARSD